MGEGFGQFAMRDDRGRGRGADVLLLPRYGMGGIRTSNVKAWKKGSWTYCTS